MTNQCPKCGGESRTWEGAVRAQTPAWYPGVPEAVARALFTWGDVGVSPSASLLFFIHTASSEASAGRLGEAGDEAPSSV